MSLSAAGLGVDGKGHSKTGSMVDASKKRADVDAIRPEEQPRKRHCKEPSPADMDDGQGKSQPSRFTCPLCSCSDEADLPQACLLLGRNESTIISHAGSNPEKGGVDKALVACLVSGSLKRVATPDCVL